MDSGWPVNAAAAITGYPPGTASVVMSGPQEPPLTIEAAVTAGTAVVVISGELDLTTTSLLSQQLAQILEDGPQRLVFDMSGVHFMDCATVRLIAGTGRCLPQGRRPIIRRPSLAVRRVLELTGLAVHCEVDRVPPGQE